MIQIILLLGITFAPGQYLGDGITPVLAIGGLVVGGTGLLVVLAAWKGLGRNLSVFPKPIDDGQLIQSGIYSRVRHPMYTGVILTAFGWALFRPSLIALALVGVLAVFFDRKAAREEIWLADKYPGYTEYRKRTRKLIPFIY